MNKELLRKIITMDKETIESISFHMGEDHDCFTTLKGGPIYDKIVFEDGVVSILVNNIEYHIIIDKINAIKIWRKEE